jgi:anthranilate synthase component 2
MILMIDNYDSFTYNLVQYLGELGADVNIVRNDAVTVADVADMNPAGIVISPGPCTPNEAGISVEVVEKLGGSTPIFGVCLGHQCIGQAHGAKVVRAKRIMHGKTSMISHDGKEIFDNVPDPFEATRYHSLVLESHSVPDCLEVTAWTEFEGEREIMGLRHRDYPCAGVQFHPESILTQVGHDLLANFLKITPGGGR